MPTGRKISALVLALVMLFSVLGVSAAAAAPDEKTLPEITVIGNDVLIAWKQPFEDGKQASKFTLSYKFTSDSPLSYSTPIEVTGAELFYTLANLPAGTYDILLTPYDGNLPSITAVKSVQANIKNLSSFALTFTDFFSSLVSNYPAIASFVLGIYGSIAPIFGW